MRAKGPGGMADTTGFFPRQRLSARWSRRLADLAWVGPQFATIRRPRDRFQHVQRVIPSIYGDEDAGRSDGVKIDQRLLLLRAGQLLKSVWSGQEWLPEPTPTEDLSTPPNIEELKILRFRLIRDGRSPSNRPAPRERISQHQRRRLQKPFGGHFLAGHSAESHARRVSAGCVQECQK
jgi:hypothetical protein